VPTSRHSIAAVADPSAPALRETHARRGRTAGTRLALPEPVNSIVQYEEASQSLIDPEIVLPVQLFDQFTKQGEKRLMLAVLEEAVGTFQRNLHAKSRRGQRLFRESAEWIASPDTTWMFSFESICHTLGLDPRYLRGGLERLKERRPGARVYRFRRVSGRRTSVVSARPRHDEGAEQRRVS